MNLYTYFAKRPSFLANRAMQSSDSPIILIAPQMAYVFDVAVMIPVAGSTSAMLKWTEAWSLAWMIRLLAELEVKKNSIRFMIEREVQKGTETLFFNHWACYFEVMLTFGTECFKHKLWNGKSFALEIDGKICNFDERKKIDKFT